MDRAGEDAFDAFHSPVDLVACDGQGWSETQDGAVRVLRQDALYEKRVANGAGRGHRRVDLDADPKPLATNFGDDIAADRAKAILHVSAHFGTPLNESLVLDDRKGLRADPRRKRIAAEGRAVRARGENAHELPRRDKG